MSRTKDKPRQRRAVAATRVAIQRGMRTRAVIYHAYTEDNEDMMNILQQ